MLCRNHMIDLSMQQQQSSTEALQQVLVAHHVAEVAHAANRPGACNASGSSSDLGAESPNGYRRHEKLVAAEATVPNGVAAHCRQGHVLRRLRQRPRSWSVAATPRRLQNEASVEDLCAASARDVACHPRAQRVAIQREPAGPRPLQPHVGKRPRQCVADAVAVNTQHGEARLSSRRTTVSPKACDDEARSVRRQGPEDLGRRICLHGFVLAMEAEHQGFRHVRCAAGATSQQKADTQLSAINGGQSNIALRHARQHFDLVGLKVHLLRKKQILHPLRRS
mmetsp:Transcript_89222/g.257266  ORF Transcript_89222/g.257266 Transcript_89222/m.257266 type:complete len:280 (-) Transcript_89222:781-1620(-)